MDGVEETWKAQLNLNEATARQKEVLADGKSTGDDRLKAIIDTMDASVGLTSAQWALDGATLEGKEKIEAQITTLQGLEAKLDKNDPLRQNLDDYINQLKDAEGTFEAKLHLTFTSDEATVRITPGKKQALAGGGFVAPHEVFTGAERGLELMALPKHGTYQAPPSGGFVIPHTQSEQILEGLAGSERPSGHAVHIETAVFGSEGALADLDWWAATRLAGV
jgi:hypothetical protein